MSGEHLPARIDVGATPLRDARGSRRPPACPRESSKTADNDRLETEDQPRRADRGIEIGADGQEHSRRSPTIASDRAIAIREHVAIVEPHQLSDVRIVH